MIVNKWTQEIKLHHDPNDAKEEKEEEKRNQEEMLQINETQKWWTAPSCQYSN